jgi:hypothetical protein
VELIKIATSRDTACRRGVLLLDPYGCQVEWSPHRMTSGKSGDFTGEFRTLISDVRVWWACTWCTTRGAVGGETAIGQEVENCVRIRDASPLDPTAEFKCFCSDIGFLAVEEVAGRGVEVELVIISRPWRRGFAVQPVLKRTASIARALGTTLPWSSFARAGELLSHVEREAQPPAPAQRREATCAVL